MGRKLVSLTMGSVIAAMVNRALHAGIDLPKSAIVECAPDVWGMSYRERPMAIKGKPSGVARAKRISRKRKNIRARRAK